MGDSTPDGQCPAPSAELARFVSNLSFERLPEDAVHTVERCFVDTVGVAVAGASAQAGTVIAESVETVYGGHGSGTLLGRETAAPLPEAAFVNGAASHALDYDDMASIADSHPSTTLVPPLLAVAEKSVASGEQVITAYVAGFETLCFLAAPNRKGDIGPGLHSAGWHPTAVFGTVGSAAATANLLGLDAAETRHAINVAVSMVSGLTASFGSLAKPMQAGHAARSGLWAALLADSGLTGIQTTIGDGFFPNYSDVSPVDPESLPDLGNPLMIVEEGISVKTYPSCYLTHTIIRATSNLVAASGIGPESVAQIHVSVPPGTTDVLVYDEPRAESEAKFSIPHAVASAFLDDHVGISSFEPDTVQSDDARRIHECVQYDTTQDIPAGSYEVTVTIETSAGEVLTSTVDTPPGSPSDPIPDEDLAEKFLECATHTIDSSLAQDAYDCLDNLREHDDVGRVIGHLDG